MNNDKNDDDQDDDDDDDEDDDDVDGVDVDEDDVDNDDDNGDNDDDGDDDDDDGIFTNISVYSQESSGCHLIVLPAGSFVRTALLTVFRDEIVIQIFSWYRATVGMR